MPISMATFNAYNLQSPGAPMYRLPRGGHSSWTADEYEKKIRWTAAMIERVDLTEFRLVPRRGEPLRLDLVDAEGQAWLYVYRLMYELVDGGQPAVAGWVIRPHGARQRGAAPRQRQRVSNDDASNALGPRSEVIAATGQRGRCGSIDDTNCDGLSNPWGNGVYDQRPVVRESQFSGPAQAGAGRAVAGLGHAVPLLVRRRPPAGAQQLLAGRRGR
jgi:hypothetical protein